MRILLVDDDERTVSFMRRGLEAEGFVVDCTGDGEDALELARDTPYTLILLDRVLPGMDGLEICRILRRERRDCLVLMVSGQASVQDKIDALKGGVDDYLTKPFAFDELLARIGALLRRRRSADAVGVMTVGDLALDPATKKVWRGEREIGLTAREYQLLGYLMSNRGAVVSRSRLLNAVWDLNFDPQTKVVDVYIRYLRRKIDDGAVTPLIKTVRGFGYMLSA
jgi:DNA-binding response OmpR family regulator